MEKMVKHISEVAGLKKSRVMIEAIAKDYSKLTGSATEVKESQNRKGNLSYFIRTTTYKVSWYEFAIRKDAENFEILMKKTLNESYGNKELKNHKRDFGILEALKFLKDNDSPMISVMEIYKTLSLALQYGV